MLAADRTGAPESSHVEAYVSGRRVLAAHDDPSLQLICSFELRYEGFDLSEAVDGQRGPEQARWKSRDLVVSDLQLPRLDRVAVADALRHHERTRATPIVFLRGETGVAERRRACMLGAAGLVATPFDSPTLVALLADVINRTPVV